MQCDIAIMGLGCSGAMMLRELIEHHTSNTPLHIALIDGSNTAPRGIAYSTSRLEHLLNVRAENMGAIAANPRDFIDWLQQHKMGYEHAAHDFLPRALYGEYLTALHDATLTLAPTRNITITHIAEHAAAITPSEHGYNIATHSHNLFAKKLILATGNPFPESSTPHIITQPWSYDFAAITTEKTPRIRIIGTGLTAVDTIISLLHSGYGGDIECLSRNGLFPQPHCAPCVPVAPPAWLLTQPHLRLSHIARALIHSAKTTDAPWQAVIDGLRPHITTLWHHLPAADRVRFLTRYFTLWNIHRHRMAQSIHAQIIDAQISKQLTIQRGDISTIATEAILTFDCRGPHYRTLPTAITILLDAQILTRDATGAGLYLHNDVTGRATDNSQPPIYVIGALQLGANLESTALPELRTQAQCIATACLAKIRDSIIR